MIFAGTDTRMFRRMGYFHDQRGIIRRYQREQEQWDAHLQRTRQFAVESMQSKGRGTAAVLGSGWLLDVPVEEMSRHFKKLYLCDIRHPAAVKKRVRTLHNTELCVCDISCFAQPVYRYVQQYRSAGGRPPLSAIQPHGAPDLTGLDFVFSCNILNQLDILLTDYLLRYFDLRRDETDAFRNSVQQHHIRMLPRGRSCMVADYEEITRTPGGTEIARAASVRHPVTQRPDAQRWTWNFDTKMTYYSNKITHFEVMGVNI